MAAIGWVLVALISAAMWGVGYSFLTPVTKVLHQTTINTIMGGTMFIVNFLVNVFQSDVTNFFELASNWKLNLFTWIYVILFTAASMLQLVGYRLVEGNAGAYNAICSTYPLVNLLTSAAFFGERDVNWKYVAPGMLMVIGGVILLAVAPPVEKPLVPGGAGGAALPDP